jgi:aminoglycoside/choline kinase family phosphotransferase/NDP-sugar pyrophosphorylase family protein
MTGAMGKVRKGMLLAAGFGSRMGPLGRDRPKAVMPLWNRSLLARNIDRLWRFGVRDLLVNAHHGAAEVVAEVLACSRSDGRMTVSFEPDILGTGGALKHAAWFFDGQPFWLMNADIAADRLLPAPFVHRLEEAPDHLAACWVDAQRGPRTVAMDNGVITDFAAPTPGAPGTGTFCGLHLVRPEVLSFLPDTGFASIIDAYRSAQVAGWRVAAVLQPESYWADVGTPARYLAEHARMASSSAAVCLAPSARVARSAKLRRCVIWEEARIAPRAEVSDAIVARQTHVRGRATGLLLPAHRVLSAGERAAWERWQGTELRPDVTAAILPARGSGRSYIRITSPQQSALLMRYDATRYENTLYAGRTRFLRRQRWPVPRLYANDAEAHWNLLEDVGDDSLESIHAHRPQAARRLYPAVIACVAALHTRVTRNWLRHPPPGALPAFGPTVYRYERELFLNHYLRDRRRVDAGTVRAVRRELQGVSRMLADAPLTLVHRDLQSSNVHIANGEPVFIDFQGMRLGPAAYDVASLLCDPYVAWPMAQRTEWLAAYAAMAGPGFRRDHYRWACIQRLCQALGAYARLAGLPGCDRFAGYIPAALQLLQESLAEVPGLPVLTQWVQTERD